MGGIKSQLVDRQPDHFRGNISVAQASRAGFTAANIDLRLVV